MFTKYRYIPNTTPSQNLLFTDIKGLITGTITNTTSLSTLSDKSNSYIVSTTPGGWETMTHNQYDVYSYLTTNYTTLPQAINDIMFIGGSINKWFLIAANGIFSSPDRITWTCTYSSVGDQLSAGNGATSIAFNGTTIVVVISESKLKPYIISSTNGTNWTVANTTITPHYTPKSLSVLGTTFLLLVDNNTVAYYTSSDGVTWIASSLTAYIAPGKVTCIWSTPYASNIVWYLCNNGLYSVTNAQVVTLVIHGSLLNQDILNNCIKFVNYASITTNFCFRTSANNIYVWYSSALYSVAYSGVLIDISQSTSNTLGPYAHIYTTINEYYTTSTANVAYTGALSSSIKSVAIFDGVGIEYFVYVGTNLYLYKSSNNYSNSTSVGTIPNGNWVFVTTGASAQVILAIGLNVCAYTTSVTILTTKPIPNGDWVSAAINLTTAAEWLVVASNGSLVSTSDTGATWTVRTSIPEPCSSVKFVTTAGGYYILATSGVLYYLATISGTATVVSTSTLQIINQPQYNNIVSNGTNIIVQSTSKTTTSTDSGTTWTNTLTSGITGDKCTINGTYFITYSSTAQKVYNSTDGISWTQVTLPSATTPLQLLTNSTDTCYITSTQIFSSPDYGVNWNSKTIQSITPTVVNTDGSILSLSSATGQTALSYKGATSGSFRALNLDGTTYKYMQIDIQGNNIYTYCPELISNNGQTLTNTAFNSNVAGYNQNFSTSGGVLYIGTSNRYCFMYGITSGGISGSTTGNGATMICEYSRADVWNTPASGYPCWSWSNSSLSNWYSPRFKYDVGSDTTGSLAVFSIASGISNSKTATAVDGSQSIIAPDIYLYNNVGNYLIEGGDVFGVKSSTTSFGITTDELNSSGNTYVLFATGTSRHAVPKS